MRCLPVDAYDGREAHSCGSGLLNSYIAMHVYSVFEVIDHHIIKNIKTSTQLRCAKSTSRVDDQSSVYFLLDLRPATPLLSTLPISTRHLSTIACFSSGSDFPCTFKRWGPRLSHLILALSRHSGNGHLSPVFLLCLLDVRIWRCRFDLASCRLPLNVLEHARQLNTVLGVSGAGDIGEMEP